MCVCSSLQLFTSKNLRQQSQASGTICMAFLSFFYYNSGFPVKYATTVHQSNEVHILSWFCMSTNFTTLGAVADKQPSKTCAKPPRLDSGRKPRTFLGSGKYLSNTMNKYLKNPTGEAQTPVRLGGASAARAWIIFWFQFKENAGGHKWNIAVMKITCGMYKGMMGGREN